jgi:uncharacterized UBP type Zn finger protein
MATCTHLETVADNGLGAAASGTGCVECLATGGHWVHLRRCLECGHIGCCDNSPGRHATAHYGSTHHPLIQSFEPGEEWIYCYVDDVAFELAERPPSPAHP